MQIGDKVSFLSEQGGGIIAGFQGKNIVLVEDEDGFQIPMPSNEVVLIQNDDYSTSRIVQHKSNEKNSISVLAGHNSDTQQSIKTILNQTDSSMFEEDTDPADKEITFCKSVEERKGGDKLCCYLAFVPLDIKTLSNTLFESYFVNDSNYYIQFSYLSAENSAWQLRTTQIVEPNTKLFIEQFSLVQLNDLNRLAIQMFAYKRNKSFLLKPIVEVQFRIDAVKFYKLHTFQANDFFEQPALLYTIIENDKLIRPLNIDAQQLKKQMHSSTNNAINKGSDGFVRRYENGKNTKNPFVIKRRGNEDIIVIDLHAHEVLETTSGMSSTDILQYQVKMVTDTLVSHQNKKGQKIVFIHGKGEGVLRRAIIHELNYRFKKYTYQDASFQEYGYGATQVTIR